MAGIYADQGKIDEALSLYKQSLEIFESTGEVKGKAFTLAHMAKLIAGQGDFETAMTYLNESLAIFEHIKSPNAEAVRQFIKQVQNDSHNINAG
ncbi:tetratricopeptide repeat protein [Desulfobacterales bacterium HSG16]|nr:tetratricopeptide repeat protein [Desulfobacterales bacterium HSG16]